jgi:hypothetical protein
MIQAGLDFLNLMNIVTRQFSHTLQLPTHEDCALNLFESNVFWDEYGGLGEYLNQFTGYW